MFQRSLPIKEKTLGKEHPGVAITLNYLADFHKNHRRYTEAEVLLRRCLFIKEKSLGKEHPALVKAKAATRTKIAFVFPGQGSQWLGMAAELTPLAENVFARVERNGFAARTVTTKLRYSDFAIVTRSRTLLAPVATADALATLAVELLEKALADRTAPVRLLSHQ